LTDDGENKEVVIFQHFWEISDIQENVKGHWLAALKPRHIWRTASILKLMGRE
jgi:hypothetical protein